jgi:rhodanese-related sulfurtransferase
MKLWKMIKALFSSAPRLSPGECGARIHSGGAFLVDVREPGEWSAGVAKHAVLLPLSDLTGARVRWQAFLEASAGREILVYCVSGGRSGIAARILVSEGQRAVNTGGLADWSATGWPVVKPPM